VHFRRFLLLFLRKGHGASVGAFGVLDGIAMVAFWQMVIVHINMLCEESTERNIDSLMSIDRTRPADRSSSK
jgi:hypothetical protein